MSRYTIDELARWTRVGFTAQRGNPWWCDNTMAARLGWDQCVWDGPVPLEVVRNLVTAPKFATVPLSAVGDVISPDGVTRIDITDSGRVAVVRYDLDDPAIVGVFSSGYRIHDYEETLLGLTADLIGDPEAADLGLEIASAGIYGELGQWGWVQVTLPSTEVAPGFPVAPFMAVTTSHDGTKPTGIRIGGRAIVCDNTHDLFTLSAVNRAYARHTAHSLDRLAMIRRTLGLFKGDLTSTIPDTYKMLVETKVTNDQWNGFVDLHFNRPAEHAPSENAPAGAKTAWTRWEARTAPVNDLWFGDDPRVAPWHGTALGALQAVNTVKSWGKEPSVSSFARQMNGVTSTGSSSDGKVMKTLAKVTGEKRLLAMV